MGGPVLGLLALILLAAYVFYNRIKKRQKEIAEQAAEQVAERVAESVAERVSTRIAERISERVSQRVSQRVNSRIHDRISAMPLHPPDSQTSEANWVDHMVSKIEEVDWSKEMDWEKTSPQMWDTTSPQGAPTPAMGSSPSSSSFGGIFGASRIQKRGDLAAQIGMRDSFPDGYSPDRTISAVTQRLGKMRPGTCSMPS